MVDLNHDPFLEGVRAYDQYESRDSNPYSNGSIEYMAWDHGYENRKHGYVDEYGWAKYED